MCHKESDTTERLSKPESLLCPQDASGQSPGPGAALEKTLPGVLWAPFRCCLPSSGWLPAFPALQPIGRHPTPCTRHPDSWGHRLL